MVAPLLVGFFVILPLLAFFSVDIAARRRNQCGQFVPNQRIATAAETEVAATRLLLCGAIERQEYRDAVATLAAHDEIAHPLHIPQR